MFEILPQTTDTCLVAHFSGKVTSEDYQQFLTAVDERLKTHSKINLVAQLTDFVFYGDWKVVKQDWQFAFGEYAQVERAAFVGDHTWIEWFVELTNPITKAEQKYFAAHQLAQACEWAC
jgi:SpoIIAA-like